MGGAAPGPQDRGAPAQGRRSEDNTATSPGKGGSMVLSRAIEWLLVIVLGLLMVELVAPMVGW